MTGTGIIVFLFILLLFFLALIAIGLGAKKGTSNLSSLSLPTSSQLGGVAGVVVGLVIIAGIVGGIVHFYNDRIEIDSEGGVCRHFKKGILDSNGDDYFFERGGNHTLTKEWKGNPQIEFKCKGDPSSFVQVKFVDKRKGRVDPFPQMSCTKKITASAFLYNKGGMFKWWQNNEEVMGQRRKSSDYEGKKEFELIIEVCAGKEDVYIYDLKFKNC